MINAIAPVLTRCLALAGLCSIVGCATVEPPPAPSSRVVERELAPTIERVAERQPPPRTQR